MAKKKKHSERDHGFGQVHGEEVAGRPVARPLNKKMQARTDADGGCPNCGCYEIMEVTIPMNNPLLRGGMGKGVYFGCPACPWASPMMTTTIAR
jgi:hypothetical protein